MSTPDLCGPVASKLLEDLFAWPVLTEKRNKRKHLFSCPFARYQATSKSSFSLAHHTFTIINNCKTKTPLTWMTPIVLTTAILVSGEQTISNEDKKCEATAINASLGHRLNQSIVQPLNRPGNFKERLRNFSPTYKCQWDISLRECNSYLLPRVWQSTANLAVRPASQLVSLSPILLLFLFYYSSEIFSPRCQCDGNEEKITYRWKAEYNMKVVLDTSNEVVIKILVGWWSLWVLSLHDANQVLRYFINLVSGEQVGYLRKMR